MNHKNPFYLIKNINDKFEARGTSECQDMGLTFSQFRTLIYLSEHSEKTVTQRELELSFNVSHPAISGILSRMEEKGFIKTEIIKENGKQQRQIFMTRKGKSTVEKMDDNRKNVDVALEKLFTAGELELFRDFLQRVFNYVNE